MLFDGRTNKVAACKTILASLRGSSLKLMRIFDSFFILSTLNLNSETQWPVSS